MAVPSYWSWLQEVGFPALLPPILSKGFWEIPGTILFYSPTTLSLWPSFTTSFADLQFLHGAMQVSPHLGSVHQETLESYPLPAKVTENTPHRKHPPHSFSKQLSYKCSCTSWAARSVSTTFSATITTLASSRTCSNLATCSSSTNSRCCDAREAWILCRFLNGSD